MSAIQLAWLCIFGCNHRSPDTSQEEYSDNTMSTSENVIKARDLSFNPASPLRHHSLFKVGLGLSLKKVAVVLIFLLPISLLPWLLELTLLISVLTCLYLTSAQSFLPHFAAPFCPQLQGFWDALWRRVSPRIMALNAEKGCGWGYKPGFRPMLTYGTNVSCLVIQC